MDPRLLLGGLALLALCLLVILVCAAIWDALRDAIAPDVACWIPEPHPYHDGCWQTPPPTKETL